MRFRQSAIGLFLFCFLGVFLHGATVRALQVITEQSPPFNYVDNGRITGSSTEVVREILRRLGSDASIRILPWARGYRMLQNEPDVALFSTARTADRENQFYWVGPLFTVHYGFYSWNNPDLRLQTLEDAKTVGAIATYKDDVKEQLLRSLGFQNLDSSNSPESNLKKLVSGRVDLWVFDNLGAANVAKSAGVNPERLRLVLPFRSYHCYIAFSKQTSPAVVRRWQETLDAMKQDGSFFRISEKWLPPDSIPGDADSVTMTGELDAGLKIYTEDSPPGNYLKDGEAAGLAVEVVREILRRTGQPDTIEVVPWARGYAMALNEPRVALFSTTRLPQRETLFQWVGPIYTQTWGFYARSDSGLKVRSMEEARAVPRIGTYHRDAKEQFLQAEGFKNLVSTNRNLSNVIHLLKGNIDLWVSSDFNMPYLVRQAGEDPSRLKEVFAFRKVNNYIAFSLQTPKPIVSTWQQALTRMKKDGSYRKICRRFDYYPVQ